MDTRTGDWIDAHSEADALEKLRLRALEQGLEPPQADDVVMIRGSLQAVQQLAQRTKLGNAELEKRKARRKAQKQGRRSNR